MADPSPAALVALPGIGFHEAIHRRITRPLVGNDPNQDLFNLALGLPALLDGRRALTPVEMAASLQPQTTLICLGYHETCRAATALDPALLPPTSLVRESLEQACATLGPSRRILSTVPDPLLSTFFLSRDIVGRWWKVEPEELGRRFEWQPEHLLPASALGSVGARLRRDGSPLSSEPPFALLTPSLAAELREGLAAINRIIRQTADRDGARLLDLESLFRELADHGLKVGDRSINAEPGGGFFSLTSFLPGPVGHGVIAEELVELLQTEPGMDRDPSDRPRQELAWEILFEADDHLKLGMTPPLSLGGGLSRPNTSSVQLTEIFTRTTTEAPSCSTTTDLSDLPADQEHLFELGPDDGCLDRILRAEDPDLMFGGPAIGRSAARGKLRLRFLPGAENTTESDVDPWARFELTFDPELDVAAAPLSAPQMWRHDLPPSRLRGTWTGLLHRQSGRIRELTLDFGQDCPFRNRLSNLSTQPPEDRLDTRLDISRSSEGVLQLSLEVTWISSWGGPESGSGARLPWLADAAAPSPDAMPTAYLSCRRVTWSQRLHLRASASSASSEGVQAMASREVRSTAGDRSTDPSPLPARSFLELTSFCHDSRLSAFARVDAPPARANVGWAHPLLGRWVLQSGEPSEGRLPILVHLLPFEACHGPPGWLGFDSEVRLGRQMYPQPPLRLSPPCHSVNMCSLDRLSDASVGPFELTLQDDRRLLTDLLKLQEPSGAASLTYRGRARLEAKSGGDLYFLLDPSFHGFNEFFSGDAGPLETSEGQGQHPSLHLEPGGIFPAPHGTSGYPVRNESRLDFGLRLTAGRGLRAPSGKLSGEERLLSSTRRLFSYRYMLSTRASDPAIFELTDHSLGGTFVLKHLAHIVFGSSPSSRARRTPDTVTFTGFGTWSLDPESGPTHRISAHLCRSRHSPFIAIAIDEGQTSSICTAFCD